MSSTINTQLLVPAQQFYQRHDTKIVLLVVILLSVYLLSVAAKFTWNFIPQSETIQTSQARVNQVSGDIRSSESKTNLSALLNLNLFGDATAAPVQQVEEVTDAPETKLNLVLSGVVASSAEGEGAAVIAYRNAQATYGISDTIEGTNVTLEEIYSDRVIIKNRLVRETLMLEGLDFDEANRRRERERQVLDQQKEEENDNMREIREQVMASPESFSEFITFAPAQDENGPIGFRVAPGRKPEFFNAVGLESGDIVVELNGLDLSNLMEAANAPSILQSEEVLDLEILRDGQYISLTIELPTE